MNPKITLAALIVMVIAGIGGWYFGKTSEETRYRVETPTDIEDVEFTLPDIRGTTRSSSEWEGKARLINFWATWCAPCRREIPLLKTTQAEYGKRNIQVIGIAVDFPEEVAAGHSRQHRLLQGKEAEFEDLPFFDASLQIEKETRSGKVYYGWEAPNPKLVTSQNSEGEPCSKLDEGLRRVDRGHANAAGLARIAQLFAQFLEQGQHLP